MNPPSRTLKHGAALIVALFVLGACARLGAMGWFGAFDQYTYDATGYLLLHGGGGDEREYEGRGWNLVSGGNFWALPSGDGDAPPAYPFFIALIYSGLGRHPDLLLIANAIFGGVAAAATWLLGRRILDAWWAYVAALAVAIDPFLIMWSLRVLTESPAVLLAVAANIAILRASRPQAGFFAPGLAGLTLGVATLVRNNMIVFVLASGAWWVLFVRVPDRKLLKLVTGLALFVAVWLPPTVVGLRSRPPGTTSQFEQFGRVDSFGSGYYLQMAREQAIRRKGSPLTSEEAQTVRARATLELAGMPLWKVIVKNTLYRLSVFWRILPSEGSLLAKVIYALRAIVLFSLALAGGLLAYRGEDDMKRVAALFLLETAALVLLHCFGPVVPRHRMLVEPMLWILACVPLAEVCRRGARRTGMPAVPLVS